MQNQPRIQLQINQVMFQFQNLLAIEDAASLLANNAEISQSSKPSEMLNLKQVVILSLLFCPLWFMYSRNSIFLIHSDNYTFNLSLALTSVSSNTILSSTSGLFTLILTVLMKVEKFNVIKLLGVLLTLGGTLYKSMSYLQLGVVMVSLSDTRNQGKDSIWGDVLALASAFTYALYVSLFKRQVKDEDRVDNGMFLGKTIQIKFSLIRVLRIVQYGNSLAFNTHPKCSESGNFCCS